MNGFFSTEGKYYKIATEFGYILILGALWLIASIPIFTIGASTTAAYYVATKRRSGMDEYLLPSFFKSYKDNFVSSLIVFAILSLFGFLIYANTFILINESGGLFFTILSIFMLIIAMQWTFVIIFAFVILARFQLSGLQVIKSAFFISNRHFKTTLLCIIIFLLVGSISILSGVLIPFAMGAYVYFTAGIFVKVFRVHNPDFDINVSDKDMREMAEASEMNEIKKN